MIVIPVGIGEACRNEGCDEETADAAYCNELPGLVEHVDLSSVSFLVVCGLLLLLLSLLRETFTSSIFVA
jgi:hypothetical protein